MRFSANSQTSTRQTTVFRCGNACGVAPQYHSSGSVATQRRHEQQRRALHENAESSWSGMETRANRLTSTNCKLPAPNSRNSCPETSAGNRAIVELCPTSSSDPKTQNRAHSARFAISIESLSLIGQVDGGALSIRTDVTEKATSGFFSLTCFPFNHLAHIESTAMAKRLEAAEYATQPRGLRRRARPRAARPPPAQCDAWLRGETKAATEIFASGVEPKLVCYSVPEAFESPKGDRP